MRVPLSPTCREHIDAACRWGPTPWGEALTRSGSLQAPVSRGAEERRVSRGLDHAYAAVVQHRQADDPHVENAQSLRDAGGPPSVVVVDVAHEPKTLGVV